MKSNSIKVGALILREKRILVQGFLETHQKIPFFPIKTDQRTPEITVIKLCGINKNEDKR